MTYVVRPLVGNQSFSPSAWTRFRGLPVWAQLLVWVFLWPVPVALYAAARPPADRKRWWALAVVVTLAWGGAGFAVQRRGVQPVEQAGHIDAPITPATDSTPQAPEGTSPTTAGEPATSTTATALPSAPPEGGSTLLARLQVAPENPRSGYARELFRLSDDADRDGCDTRREVLIAESLTSAHVGAGCTVTGRWFSAYDGVTTTDPSGFDIDHVVALAEAWDSGAFGWDPARRRDFANDLDYEGSLIAVSASSNRSKGDRDPAEWMPPRPESWCQFATDWVSVKVRWSLTADRDEVAALRTALDTCDTSSAAPPPLAPAPTTTTTVAQSSPSATGAGVTISALDCGGERVTVSNPSSATVNLTGWTIQDEGAKHTFAFPDGYSLRPGASAVVRSGGVAGPGELSWTGAPVWNNDGDVASLVNAGRATISTRSC